MLLHKDVEHDSRVHREAAALVGAGHRVVLVHLPGNRSPAAGRFPFIVVSASCPTWVRRVLPFRSYRLVEVATMIGCAVRARPGAIHCHDAAMLVPGYIAAHVRRSKLVYDSHELATGVPYHSRAWYRLVGVIERLIVPRCDAVITVSDGIADRLQQRYRLRERPTVLRNLSDLPTNGAAPDLREELGIDDAPFVLHQGAVAADRGCENLVRAVSALEGAHLLFLGAEGPYVEGLHRLAIQLGIEGRIHFYPPVPMNLLLAHTTQADVGVSLLEINCENHRLALPNKVFEYLRAGIPVLVTAGSELSQLVARLEVGESAKHSNPADVRERLRSLLAMRGDARLRHGLRLAGERYSWEVEKGRLVALYSELGSRPDHWT